MPNVLILCHGNLAGEIVNTARMILGEHEESLRFLNLAPGQDMEQYHTGIVSALKAGQASGGTLILTDIMGGSPFLHAARAYGELKDELGIEIVTGVNLPMLLEVVSQMGHTDLVEAKQIALHEGSMGVKDFSAILEQTVPERR